MIEGIPYIKIVSKIHYIQFWKENENLKIIACHNDVITNKLEVYKNCECVNRIFGYNNLYANNTLYGSF